MNIFDSVKNSVSVREAAMHYGINVNNNNMCRCPFHPDRHPSMKVDGKYFGRFYCFGCNETGDVIDFIGKLFGLSNIEAAKKLSEDFGITYDNDFIGKGKHEKSFDELKREKEAADRKAFAVWKRDFSNEILRLLSDMREIKYLAETEALKLLESKSDYCWIKENIEAVENCLEIIYDETDEKLKAESSELERQVKEYERKFADICGSGNRAS